jgi:hypothetical protein
MARKASKYYDLEDLYCSGTTHKSMELSALRDITNEFSTESEIGRGASGVVYKVPMCKIAYLLGRFYSTLYYKF